MDTTADFSPYRQDGKLYGFVCVVTGASQPVGQAIIEELAAHGAASIYACDKTTNEQTFKPLTSSLAQTHPNTKIIPYPFNVAKEDETLTLIDEVLASFGRLDVWVCSSGFLGPPSIYSTTADDLHKNFEAHSLAPFFALKHAPAAMGKMVSRGDGYPNAAPKTQKYGSIIVISSVASTYGGCWGPSYTMAAHAALGVVRAGVAVLKGSNVRINAISPGQIDIGVDLHGMDMKGMNSQQFPPMARMQEKEAQEKIIGLERAGRPQEVARVAGFLASGFSSYITGANLVVDGGACAMNPVTIPI
ncbi:3-oxoacyl-reductase [Rhypophila decipiens]|uniref:Peroxisomal trans-2-enoyl-CoA reductase n=1 Tax=Rhypophila decipiens TaxID=261697 RepID=A0AAN6YGH4_9PEZI|nr:3-oxoacyl-reductase [Rhypophila decipiens]